MESSNEWQPAPNPWLVALTMVLPTFMVVLDTSVANVSLPYIAGSMSASTDEATWVLTSYLVANAIFLPATDWMSRLFGRKRLLIASIFIFTISSGVSGAAASLDTLIIARVIQGASGGVLVPICQAVLLESFPSAERGQAMAIFGMGVIVAPVVGPTLGGWITDTYSWRWVFYINLPVGLLAVLMARALVEDPPHITQARRTGIDYIGFGLMAIGLGTLQVVLDRGQQDDWFSAIWIRWFSVISAISLVAFLFWELRTKDPIVHLRILADRNFSVGISMAATYGVILYGTLFMLPVFLVNLMGYSALTSGLSISPRGIGAMISVSIAGRLIKRVDGRLLIVMGFLTLFWATFLFGNINLEISMTNIALPNLVLGLALGFIFVPLTTIAVATLPDEQLGTATGLYNLMRNMGGSIGIAAITTFLARDTQSHQAMMVSRLTPYNPLFQNALHRLQETLFSPSDLFTAAQRASGAIYRTLTQQANLLAYVDNFRLLGLLALVGIPLTFLLKKAKRDWGSERALVD